jgi:Protein of unknown function (DUF3551)
MAGKTPPGVIHYRNCCVFDYGFDRFLNLTRNSENVMFRRLLMQRWCAIAFAMLALLVVFAPSLARADTYKWCAVKEATNCGFVTIEQCRAAISGTGGSCELNQFYTRPDEKPAKRPPKSVRLHRLSSSGGTWRSVA